MGFFLRKEKIEEFIERGLTEKEAVKLFCFLQSKLDGGELLRKEKEEFEEFVKKMK